MIGQVTAFDAAKQTISAQPVLKQLLDGDDEADMLPIIEDVPLVLFGSGDMWMTVDISVGSYVLLLVSERAIETWLDQGGIVDPQRNRIFDLSDAIAIPGINPYPDILPGLASDAITLRLRDNTASITLETDGTITLSNGNGHITLANNGKATVNDHLTVEPA
jgi:hypothetical protein